MSYADEVISISSDSTVSYGNTYTYIPDSYIPEKILSSVLGEDVVSVSSVVADEVNSSGSSKSCKSIKKAPSVLSCTVEQEHRIQPDRLDAFLRARPTTRCYQTKYNKSRTKKYEYRYCLCGCSYKITLTHADDYICIKESVVPTNHVNSNCADMANDSGSGTKIRCTDKVKEHIDYLCKRHRFDLNYGAQKVRFSVC